MNFKRIITALLVAATMLTLVPFGAMAANAYWGYDSYDTIAQPGAPAEITAYPTTITKVNNNTYTLTSALDGGRSISVSLIKEAWGTFNLGNWILTDGGTQHNFTGASTDMEYVHIAQTLNGNYCYTGGNHGNEAFVSIDFYNAETGAKLDFSSQSSYTTNGVHIIEKTKLLRFNDANSDSIGDYDGVRIAVGNYTDNDVYADVVRKYTIMGPQIKLNVDYTFTRDIIQWRSYNCMFPIDKKYSLYCDMIDKNGAILKTITSRPYGDTTIANYAGPHNDGNDATRAVIYSKDYPNYQFDIRVNTYKDSLNEHKNATYKTSYWDMNSTHNKLYFTKYGDGGSMAVTQRAGTEYHTECIWRFNYVTQGRQPSEGEIPISRGKSYTNDINAGSLEFNTSYGAKLTDGIASDIFDIGDGATDYGSMIDDSWYLFSMYSTNVVDGVGTTVIDLGAKYDLTKVRLHLANVEGMSVGAPSSIKVYASDDNGSFNQIATVPTQSGANDIYWTSADISEGVSGRYVKFEFTIPSGLAYVNEIEVYGDEYTEPEDPNLALGQDYTISGTNDPVVDPQWNVDYSAKLNDGKAYEDYAFNGGHWFMFSSSSPNVSNGKGSVQFDFDKICNITKFKMHLINNPGSSVNAPKSIKVYTSVDGKNYELAGSMPINQTSTVGYWSVLEVDNIKAGSVRFEIELNGGYAPLNEIEIRGTKTDEAYTPTTDDGNGDGNGNGNGNGDGNGDKKYLRGDVNKNDKIDSRDYLLLKRAYFGTTKLDDIARLAADVNNNGKIDSRDYLLLKRVYFGTSSISEENKFI